MDIQKLSAIELKEEAQKRTFRLMEAMQKLIDAGRGSDSCVAVETMQDELSLEYQAANKAEGEIYSEILRRYGHDGTLNPIPQEQQAKNEQ